MSLLSPASAINHVLKPALIFAAVTAQSAQAAPHEYYVDAETAKSVTYDKNPDHVVRIFGSIDSSTAKSAIERLYEISNEDSRAPIVVEISSGGGEVYPGLAILDVMNTIPNPVTTICLGIQASMAAMIAIGNKGENYATENCRIMIHEPSIGTTGTASALEQTTENIKITKNLFVEIISEATGLPESYAEDLVTTGNTYMTAEDAVGLNLLDGIIPSIKEHPAPKREVRVSEAFCDETRKKMAMCQDMASARIAPAAQTAEQRDFAGPAVPNP